MNTNVINEKNKEHSITWFPFGPEVGFVKAIGSDESLHLPVFLTGKDLDLFKKSGGVNFNPENLVIGILLGLQDNPPTLNLQEIKPFLIKGLDLLVSEYRFKGLEELVLSIAANLRENIDLDSSTTSLVSGLQLLPESDKIRSDLIVTLWATMQAEGSMIDDKLVKIQEIGSGIQFNNLDKGIAPAIAYILSVAMIYTEFEGTNNFINTTAKTHLTDPELLGRLNRLINGERLTISELSIDLT